MKLAYPAFSEAVTIGSDSVLCAVIENQPLFRTILCDLSCSIDGGRSDIILSDGDRILDLPKYVDIITNFINFDLNQKSLITKIISELEKTAVSPEHYLKTQELLAEIENAVDTWAFSFPCDIIPSKVSVSTLLKSVGVELRNDYIGHVGAVEKILDYMELVREFDREKLFVTVNMRSYFNDALILEFQKTVVGHEYHVLMLESQSFPILEYEKRITIDADLCEF